MTTPTIATNGRRTALPENVLDVFRQLRGGADSHQWAIGESVDNAVIELAGYVTQVRIYREAAKEIDCSVGQIRKCRETFQACADLRGEYDDVLLFEHFASVRFVDDRAKREAYLRLAVESADAYGGRPMPAAKLSARVRADLGLEPPAPEFGELLTRALHAVERARDACEDEQLHQWLSSVCQKLEAKGA